MKNKYVFWLHYELPRWPVILLEVLVSFSSLNMVGRTLCLNLNVMGPVCPVNFQRLCRLCLQHFLNGGSQRRHCCTCGFRTRCIKELLDHIARQRLREAGIHCDPCAEARHRQHRIGCVCAVLPMFLNNYWRYGRIKSRNKFAFAHLYVYVTLV